MNNDLIYNYLSLAGEKLVLGGNRFFLLDDPELVWFIAEGSVDVFVVRVEDGQVAGPRSFFFDAFKGELLFGMATSEGLGRNLLAVPAPDTLLYRIKNEKWEQLRSDQILTQSFSRLFEGWVEHLSRAISKDFNPRCDVLLEPGFSGILEANLKMRSKRGVVWIELTKGNALFLGIKEIPEADPGLLIPLSPDSWVQAVDPIQLEVCDTLSAVKHQEFTNSIRHFYATVLYCDFVNARLFAIDEFNRLSERKIIRENARTEALANIADVLKPRKKKLGTGAGKDPVEVACRLVARASGLSLRIPEKQKLQETKPLSLNEILQC